jgi:hypothetical protein
MHVGVVVVMVVLCISVRLGWGSLSLRACRSSCSYVCFMYFCIFRVG